MEIGNFIILIYFCVIGYANSVTYYQAVWYDSYIDNSGDPNINNYHVIKQKISLTDEFLNFYPISYKVLIKRSSLNTNIDTINVYDNDQRSVKFGFFILKINGDHYKNKKFTLWDISCSAGILTYKIKYFDCDSLNDAFYTVLGLEKDKIKNDGSGSGLNASLARLKDTSSAYANVNAMILDLTTDSCT